ncbi:hypothetical protein KEM52_000998, partial [Ascosphaera acerosa]
MPPGTLDRVGRKMQRLNLGVRTQSQAQSQAQSQSQPDEAAAPPAVPLASKPAVPLATRPILPAQPQSQPTAHAMPSSTDGCLVCRDFSGPDSHAARYPRHGLPTRDLHWLAAELTVPFASPTDKARAIFTWLHHNIHYDVAAFFGGSVAGSTPEQTLASGLAVCDGYAGLFLALATHAGLECRKLSGHGKGFGYAPLRPGEPAPAPSAGHAWNAVRVDGGAWKLVDATWGAGHVNADHTYSQRFHEEQFTMSNEEFGLKHFPLVRAGRAGGGEFQPAPPEDMYFASPGMQPPSWEQYIRINPDAPTGVEPPLVYSNVEAEHGIGKYTFRPAGRDVCVTGAPPPPVRFQFALRCPHWSLQRHSRLAAPYVFIFIARGRDGAGKEYIPFHHEAGGGGGQGGGDTWYVDVQDPSRLGPPGEKLVLYAVT